MPISDTRCGHLSAERAGCMSKLLYNFVGIAE